MKKYIPIIACLLFTACDKSATDHQIQTTREQHSHESVQSDTPSDDSHDLNASSDELHPSDDDKNDADIQPIITPDGKTKIDWSLIHTSTPKADLSDYPYPIALDSNAVKNYAKAYGITDKQAQHSIVISMASPEVLSKILDQLKNDQYVSHHLTDGADMSLVITATSDVIADKSDYVFEGEFGRGLVLPVVIKPSQKHHP